MEVRSIEERVREIAARVAGDHHLELVHVEVAGSRRPVVRIVIDKPEGITHQDCSEISLHVGTILDVEDFIPSAYTLEVSSPGLERELYTSADYARFAGHLAKLKTRAPLDGQRNFRGRIVGVEGTDVIFDDRARGRARIPFETIAKAHLEIDIEEEFRRAKQRQQPDGE
jgi:ribosome maturation factor RimP